MSIDVWNLVHVITQLELGGAQLATMHEVEHSEFPRGRRFLMHGPGGMLDREARKLDGVECIEVAALGRDIAPAADARAFRQLRGLLVRLRRQHRGERWIVHTHSSKAGVIGRWAARSAGVDVVVHSIHGFGHNRLQTPALRTFLLGLEQTAAVITDGFTADSAANIEQGRAEGIIAHIPTRVVRCGIDVDRYAKATRDRSQVRAELGIPDDHAVVLNLSCLKPQKDPEATIRLARRVVDEVPNTTFLLAGDGELRERVESLVDSLDLSGCVRLLGWRTDVPDLLGASDVLVTTSLWEGLPQAFAQAMAAGLPIVATRIDGAPEAITHQVNGLLFDVGDLDGMAAGLTRLLVDSELRTRMGEAGKPRVNDFSAERMVRDLDEFYAELVGRRRRRRERGRHAVSLARRWLARVLPE